MSVDDFRVVRGYRFSRRLGRWFFGLAFLLLVPMIFFVVLNGFFGFGWVGFSCDPGLSSGGLSFCDNPVYGRCGLVNDNPVCYEEFVPVGFEYNLNPFLDGLELVVFGLVAAFFVVNHLVYNRRGFSE